MAEGETADKLSTALEKEREDIANLQVKVQKLVARRAGAVPEKKREAEELTRDVQTLAHNTSPDAREV